MAAPKGNTNAETWNLEEATAFMDKAVELSYSSEYDFKGEIAQKLNSYHQIFSYLSKKFPQLRWHEKIIISNTETNCFSNAKKGNINASVAIMNLKSNHKWTDRTQTEHSGELKLPSLQVEIVKPNESK